MTQIWAHRGASAEAPENTLPAFERAIAAGADGVEFDVQLTADGVPVVIHDETLDRTTDGAGPVRGHSSAELSRFDASAGHAGFAGVTVPTLSEVLRLLAPTGLRINIELKNSVVGYPGLEERVLASVAEHSLAERVVLSSFNQESVARLAKLTSIEVAVVFSVYARTMRPWRAAARLGARAIHPPYRRTSPRLIREARAAGLAVRPWIVNTPRQLGTMFALGVDGVFTDHPGLALELDHSRGGGPGPAGRSRILP